MKKILLAFGIGVSCINVAFANIDVILEDEINFANSQGVLNSNVIYNNQAFQAFGTYKISKDLKVIFEIDRLMKGQKLSILDKKPRLTKRLNNANAKLPKGTKLTLKGENKKEFKDFAEQVKALDSASSAGTSKSGGTKTPSSAGGSGGGSQGAGGGSIGSGGTASTGSNSTMMPPYISTSGSGSSNNNKNLGETTWSSQFCKVPEFLPDNTVKLVIVDKDGSCVEKKGMRDDTKCQYRYDFANNKAIKQTQYYYVDNENTMQTVGDCVDLQGEQYQAELYKDDTRCSLEHIDKDYNGGKARFFVTQILFRGIDGLIHNATDCITYGNVKEELVEHIIDSNTKTAQRVVNQYYIDPYTNEKTYITKGVRTDKIFNFFESYCGEWEMDDVAKRGRKATQISFYDEVEYKNFDVTNCDFSNQMGKKIEYVINYYNLSNTYKEKELSRKSLTHNINHQEIHDHRENWKEGSWYKKKNKSASHFVQNLKHNVNWTVTYITKDVTDYETWLRPDGTIYQYNKNPSGATFVRTDRQVKINRNTPRLSNNWLLYWEIHNKHYSDPTTEKSNNYQSWLNSRYKKNPQITTIAYCQQYNITNNHHADDYWSCRIPLKYDLIN